MVSISLNFVAIVFVEFESFANFCDTVAESDFRACHLQRAVLTMIQKQKNKINFALFCFVFFAFFFFIISIY